MMPPINIALCLVIVMPILCYDHRSLRHYKVTKLIPKPMKQETPPENALIPTPLYRNLGPSVLQPLRPIDSSEPAYYDPSVPCPSPESTRESIQQQHQNQVHLQSPPTKRYPISSSFPQPYYDPTGDLDNAVPSNKMYVVPVNLQDDLRDEENELHKKLKEGLKQNVMSARMARAPYYDPTRVMMPDQVPSYDNYARLHDPKTFNNTNYQDKTLMKTLPADTYLLALKQKQKMLRQILGDTPERQVGSIWKTLQVAQSRRQNNKQEQEQLPSVYKKDQKVYYQKRRRRRM